MRHIKYFHCHCFILLIGIILPFFLFFCSSPEVISLPIAQKEYTYDYSPIELETMNLINDHRISIGLNKLEINNYVSIKCEEHNNHMLLDYVPCHDAFVARSEDIMNNIPGVINVSENVAYNYCSAKSVLNAWLLSPSHKKNIESTTSTHFGISIKADSLGRKYYTNIFIEIKK